MCLRDKNHDRRMTVKRFVDMLPGTDMKLFPGRDFFSTRFYGIINYSNSEKEETAMKRLMDAVDRYLRDCTWKDIAVLKFCLLALGVMLGIAVPARKKTVSAWLASLVFVGTYVPLMGKFLPYLLNGREAEEEKEL